MQIPFDVIDICYFILYLLALSFSIFGLEDFFFLGGGVKIVHSTQKEHTENTIYRFRLNSMQKYF